MNKEVESDDEMVETGSAPRVEVGQSTKKKTNKVNPEDVTEIRIEESETDITLEEDKDEVMVIKEVIVPEVVKTSQTFESKDLVSNDSGPMDYDCEDGVSGENNEGYEWLISNIVKECENIVNEITKKETCVYKKSEELTTYDFKKLESVVDQNGDKVSLPSGSGKHKKWREASGFCVRKGKPSQKYINFLNICEERMKTTLKKPGVPRVGRSEKAFSQPVFSKRTLVDQYISVCNDIENKVMNSIDNVKNINVGQGKTMIDEVRHVYKYLNSTIMPCGKEGLKDMLKRTVFLKLNKTDGRPHELEYLDSRGEYCVKESPVTGENTSYEDMKTLARNWVITHLKPLLMKWTQEFEDNLPIWLKSVANVIGFDCENYAVQEQDRGDCSICNRGPKHCQTNTLYLLHFRIGVGALLIFLEGNGASELGENSRLRPDFIPKNSKCIPPTRCELQKSRFQIATLDVLLDLLVSEESGALPISFNAMGAERRSVEKLLEITGIPQKGARILEADMFNPESLGFGTFEKYTSENPADPKMNVQKGAGTQTLYGFGRRACGGLWQMPHVQGSMSLKDVIGDNWKPSERKERYRRLMFLVYNTTDSTFCLYSLILAMVSRLFQYPLLILGGYTKFSQDLFALVVELMARQSTRDQNYWRLEGNDAPCLPKNSTRLFQLIEDLKNKDVNVQLKILRGGLKSWLNIKSNVQLVFTPNWGENLTAHSRRSEPSTPLIVESAKKNKALGVVVNSDEVMIGNPGVITQIVPKQVAMWMDTVDVSPDKPVENAVNVSPSKSVKRRNEAVDVVMLAEEPEEKRVIVESEKSKEPIVSTNEDIRKYIEYVPEVEEIVNLVESKDSLSAENITKIGKEIQAIVDQRLVRKSIGINPNSDGAIKHRENVQKEREKITDIEKIMKENGLKIRKLTEEQTLLKEQARNAKANVVKMQELESLRKQEELEDILAKRETMEERTVESAKGIMRFINRKFQNADCMEVEDSLPDENSKKQFNSLDVKSTKKCSEDVPHLVAKYVEKFLEYCNRREEIIHLVETICQIMSKCEEATKEFQKLRQEEEVRNGCFLKVGPLGRMYSEVVKRGPTHWGYGKDLIHAFGHLADLHVNPQTPKPQQKIQESDNKKERTKKRHENQDAKALTILNDFVKKVNAATIEVTGKQLCKLWYCEEYETSYNIQFHEIAKGIASDRVWKITSARKLLEYIVVEHVRPGPVELRTEGINKILGEIERDEASSSSRKSMSWAEEVEEEQRLEPSSRFIRLID